MRQSTYVLIATAIAAFLTPFLSSAVTVALPSIGAELGADAARLNWVATSFLLAAAMFLVPAGKLADIHGRRRLFQAGMVLFTVASVACALAPTDGVLIALRAVQGTGGAMMFGTGTAILTSVFPPERRGRVLGVNIGIVYVGLSIGPFVGGLLTDALGWRSLFVAGALLGAAGIVATAAIRDEWAEARGERFDWIGSIVYAAGLPMLMRGLSGLPHPSALLLLAAGAACLAVFAWRGLRVPHPVLDLSLFRGNPVFAWSNVAALAHYSATFAVGYLMSLYLQVVRGMTAREAGLLMVVQPVVQAAFSPLAGRVSDRVQPRILASAGMMLTIAGLVPLAAIDDAMPLPVVAACLGAMGLGFALFSSPNTSAIMGAVQRRSFGVASATLATSRLVGQMLSMGLVMVAFSFTVGEGRITSDRFPAFLDATHAVLAAGIGLCTVGVFASLARGRTGAA